MTDAIGNVVHVFHHVVVVDHLGGALEQAAVQVEYVTGIGLTTGRTTQQQRYLTISHGLFGQIIVDDQCRATGIAEEFADGSTGKRCVELQRSRIGSGGRHDDGIIHRTVVLQGLHHTGDGRRFLSNRYVDAIHRLTGFVKFFLVDDRVETDRGLSGLTVTDHELTLSTSDGNHCIDRFETGLQRLFYGLTKDYTGCFALQGHFIEFAGEWTLSVDGFSEGIHHPADHAFAHVDGGDLTGTFYFGTFLDVSTLSHQYHTHVVFFQVQRDGTYAVFELDQFTVANVTETVHTGDAVTYLQHGSYFFQIGRGIEVAQLLAENRGDLIGLDC